MLKEWWFNSVLIPSWHPLHQASIRTVNLDYWLALETQLILETRLLLEVLRCLNAEKNTVPILS